MLVKFKTGKEMYEYLESGRDLYSQTHCMYVFLYNSDGALCLYHISPEEAKKLSSMHSDGEAWSSHLGVGGKILDNETYDRVEQHKLYLQPSYEFCEEHYSLDDWEDVTNEESEGE